MSLPKIIKMDQAMYRFGKILSDRKWRYFHDVGAIHESPCRDEAGKRDPFTIVTKDVGM